MGGRWVRLLGWGWGGRSRRVRAASVMVSFSILPSNILFLTLISSKSTTTRPQLASSMAADQTDGEVVVGVGQQIQQMSDSRISDNSLSSAALPRKEEWALLYGHRAMEHQQAKSMQKMLNQQKKQEFKRQLDAQMSSKATQGQEEKEADRRYYEMITRQAQETKEKEQRDKFQKYLQLKQIEEHNQRSLASPHNPKAEDYGKVYNIPIGVKSEEEKREKAASLKKEQMLTLEQQKEEKEALRRLSRQQEEELQSRNAAIQEEQFSKRILNSKKYEQNQAVFDYYRQLHQQQELQKRQTEEQLHLKQQQLKTQQDELIKQLQANNKQKRTIEMRDTLEQQVEMHNHRKQEEAKPNPEQATYAFISSIFREKQAPYDKKQYSLFLERQAQEQRLARKNNHYMTEEEYRLNANQLQKATGQPAPHYHDRSMDTLGITPPPSTLPILPNEDAQLVRNKLDTLRSKRNRSMMHSSSFLADYP